MRRIKQIMQFTSYPTASPDSGIDSSRLDLSRLRPSRLWRASVFVTVLLCCAVLALCQEGKEGASEQILRAAVAHHSGINSYSVNKRLADFPENPGSETPENAYAKMMLDTDANIVKEVDIQTYKDTTRILEVMTKENCACVFAYKERYDMVSNAYEITPEGAFTPVHEADIVKGTPVPMYEAAIFHKQKDQWILDFSMMSSSLEGLTGNVVESEFFGKEPKFIVDGEFIANGDIAESVEKHHAEPVRPEELTEKQRKEYMNSLRIHLINRTAELKQLEMQRRFILSGHSTEEQKTMLADLNKRAIDLNQMVTYYLDDYHYLLSIIVIEEEKKYMERLSERTSNIEAGLTRLLEWIDQQWGELEEFEGKSGENTQRSPSVESEQRKINTELNARMSRLEEMLKNLETQRQSPSDAALPIAPVEIPGDSRVRQVIMEQLNDCISDIERQLGHLNEEYVNGVFLDPVDQKKALKAWRNRADILVEMMKHSQEQYQRLSSNGLTETQKEFMAQLDLRMSYLKGMLQNIDTIIQKQEGQKQEE